MKKSLIDLCILTILFSCQEVDTNEKIAIKPTLVEFDKEPADLGFLDMVDSLVFIPLEFKSGKSSFFEIDRIKILGDQIILLEERTNTVASFSLDGSFNSIIGEKGSGPGEYVDAADLDVYDSTIYVYGKTRFKVIKYQKDGTFISEIPISFFAERMAVTDSGYFFNGGYYDEEGFNLIFTDLVGNVKSKALEFPLDHDTFPFNFTGGLVKTGNNSILYTDVASSEIFEIQKGVLVSNITYRYKINFPEKNWPEEKKFNHNEFFTSLNEGYYFLRSYYNESPHHLVFEYNKDSELKSNYPQVAYYFKEEDRLITAENLKPSIFKEYMSGPVGVYDDFFLAFLFSGKILKNEGTKPTDSVTTHVVNLIKESLDTANTEPNPVLVFYRLKKNL